MKPCLNCGSCVGVEQATEFFVECPKCKMRGPSAPNEKDAEMKWDAIPRFKDASKVPDTSLDSYLKLVERKVK